MGFVAGFIVGVVVTTFVCAAFAAGIVHDFETVSKK